MLAIAGLSVRAPVQLARAAGWPVLALDLFGDLDTRAAAGAWRAIGSAESLAIDGALLCQALAEPVPGGGRVSGWMPASGLEADAGLLAAAARVAPLLGTAPADVARLREPRGFFAALARLGLPHPAVSFSPPTDPTGWLCKDMAACGGWGVRPAPAAVPGALPPAVSSSPSIYWQRQADGVPMSATVLADGRRSLVLGHNLQQVRPLDGLPYVFAGVIGPVPVAAEVAGQVADAAQALTAHFGLRGLASLDFLLAGGCISLLEVNPRLPASAQLYPDAGPQGLFRAHLQACRQGLDGGSAPGLSAQSWPLLPAYPAPQVRGLRIVHADRPLRIDAALSGWLAGQPALHDQPVPGTVLRPGDPLCSLSAQGADADSVDRALRRAEAGLLALLAQAAPPAPPARPARSADEARRPFPSSQQPSEETRP